MKGGVISFIPAWWKVVSSASFQHVVQCTIDNIHCTREPEAELHKRLEVRDHWIGGIRLPLDQWHVCYWHQNHKILSKAAAEAYFKFFKHPTPTHHISPRCPTALPTKCWIRKYFLHTHNLTHVLHTINHSCPPFPALLQLHLWVLWALLYHHPCQHLIFLWTWLKQYAVTVPMYIPFVVRRGQLNQNRYVGIKLLASQS